MTNTTIKCEGCGDELSLMDVAMGWSVCMPCVKARHRSATTGGRCKCGSKKRAGAMLGRPRQRQWIPCLRCLGTIKQVA